MHEYVTGSATATTTRMSPSEIEELLATNDTAVLALARGDDAYAIPVGYQAGPDALYFRLGAYEGSEKMTFVETTDQATAVLYVADSPYDSWSVVVRGPIRAVSTEMLDGDRPAGPDSFIPIRIRQELDEEIRPTLYELTIESSSGHRTTR